MGKKKKNQAVARMGVYSGGKAANTYRGPQFQEVRTVMTEPNACNDTKGSDLGITAATDSVNNRPTSSNGLVKGRVGGFRRLSKAEKQDKIKKGVCFRSDEKYNLDHVSKKSSIK